MPTVGLGTWKSMPGEVGRAVEYAILECGYMHVDCAAIYRNEKEIGQTFKKVFGGGLKKREEVFVTSKLWNMDHKKEDVRKACESTLKDLNLDYLDLYLMHWGIAIPRVVGGLTARDSEQLDENEFLITEKVSIRETWEAMQELVAAGLVKAIGVANFTAPMLWDLLTYAKIKPAVNQVELHPYLQQQELVDYCKYLNIAVTAYSPLGSPGNYKVRGFPVVLEDPAVINVANNYKKTPAQVLIRWAIQRQTIAIPKSVSPQRTKENIEIFDFELSEADMKAIAGLNRNLRFVNANTWWKIPYF